MAGINLTDRLVYRKRPIDSGTSMNYEFSTCLGLGVGNRVYRIVFHPLTDRHLGFGVSVTHAKSVEVENRSRLAEKISLSVSSIERL